MLNSSVTRVILSLALASLLSFTGALAAIWVGPTDGDWFTDANWDPSGVPGPGDAVSITNGRVLLTNSTANLAEFTLTNAVVVFSNWDTTLAATNLAIWNNGTITVANAFTTSQMSNRVRIVCAGGFLLNSGGAINVNELGYAKDNGPGKGIGHGEGSGGGGHGGQGGCSFAARGGAPYDSTNEPVMPGSGGGSGGGLSGGAGGGAIRIDAGSMVVINGLLTANGAVGESWGGVYGGCGSGGSIWISGSNFTGTNGVITANGGIGSQPLGVGGGGGGGRIAIAYTTWLADTTVQLSADQSPGRSWGEGRAKTNESCIGTIWLSGAEVLNVPLNQFRGYLMTPSASIWSVTNLTMMHASLGVPDGKTLSVANNLVAIGTNTFLYVGELSGISSNYPCLTCGGNLVLTNGASLVTYCWVTNGPMLHVTGDMALASSSWVYPYSHHANGGYAWFKMSNLSVASNAGFNANGLGYGADCGPGNGLPSGGGSGGGAGHGGKGGNSANVSGGASYDFTTNAPVMPGSGGGFGGGLQGGAGGGVIRIEAGGKVALNGSLTANGMMGGLWSGTMYGGCGAGGTIYMTCSQLSGVNGAITADGGTCSTNPPLGGGGGGGRIAVWVGVPRNMRTRYLNGETVRAIECSTDLKTFSGVLSVTNGAGYYDLPDPEGAYPGTCFFFKYTKGTQFRVF